MVVLVVHVSGLRAASARLSLPPCLDTYIHIHMHMHMQAECYHAHCAKNRQGRGRQDQGRGFSRYARARVGDRAAGLAAGLAGWPAGWISLGEGILTQISGDLRSVLRFSPTGDAGRPPKAQIAAPPPPSVLLRKVPRRRSWWVRGLVYM